MNSSALVESTGACGIIDGGGSTGGRQVATAADGIRVLTPPPLSASPKDGVGDVGFWHL
ncbi:hypothetical protein U1Q18_002428, partial [Sarracenia purpurea var. burkii]